MSSVMKSSICLPRCASTLPLLPPALEDRPVWLTSWFSLVLCLLAGFDQWRTPQGSGGRGDKKEVSVPSLQGCCEVAVSQALRPPPVGGPLHTALVPGAGHWHFPHSWHGALRAPSVTWSGAPHCALCLPHTPSSQALCRSNS